MAWMLSWVPPSGLVIFIGALIAAVGGYMAFVEQRRQNDLMTGGDSYLAIVLGQDPAGSWALTWKHHGNHHLYDVEVSIDDPDPGPLVRLGTVTSNSRTRSLHLLSVPGQVARRIRTEVNARNDLVVQVFVVRPVANRWVMEIEEFYRGSERGQRLSETVFVPKRKKWWQWW